MIPRYFVRSEAMGWSVVDSQQGVFPTYRIAEAFWLIDHGRDWNATHAAAVARAAELNGEQ